MASRGTCVGCGSRRVLPDGDFCASCTLQEAFGRELTDEQYQDDGPDLYCSLCDAECSGHA